MPAPYIHRPPLRHQRNTYRAFPLEIPTGFNRFITPPTFGNTATITVSVWLRDPSWETGTDNIGIIGFCQGSGPRFVFGARSTSGTLRLEGSNGATTTLDANIAAIPVNSWYHFLASIDVNAGTLQVYVNGSDYSANVTTTTLATSDVISVAGNTPRIFSRAAALGYIGYAADMYINCAAAIDLSVAANVEKFIRSGKPVYLGPDGSYPTGSRPAYFFTRTGEAAWARSTGSVTGNFTISGTFLEAPNSPSD